MRYPPKTYHPVFRVFQKRGILPAFRPIGGGTNPNLVNKTLNGMLRAKLFEKIDAPMVNLLTKEEMIIPHLALSDLGLRTFYTAGYILPFTHDVGWGGYSDWKSKKDNANPFVDVRIRVVGDNLRDQQDRLKRWCFDNDVAAQLQATCINAGFVFVEASNRVRFQLAWGSGE